MYRIKNKQDFLQKMKAIIEKTILTAMLVFYISIRITAQTFELDAVKQVPSIDESNMKLIASSVWYLYENAMKAPIKFTNPSAAYDTVFTYKDAEINGKHEKLSRVNGRLYTLCYKDELDLNNRLLFNLQFDVSGKLMVPDKIYAISNRQEIIDGDLLTKGCWAFELVVTDSIRAELIKVKLERPALSGITDKKGEFNAVEVKIPFQLTHLKNSQNIQTTLEIRHKKFQLFSEEKGSVYESDTNLIHAILEFMEYKLLQYKSGIFKFVVIRYVTGLQLDLNIQRNNVWNSQQTKNFPAYTYKVTNCEGKGVKSRYYRKVRKNVELKLGHRVKHWPALAE